MNRLESIKEQLELGNKHDTKYSIPNDQVEWLLQRLERYETLIIQARDKTQILASYCAHVKGIGYNLDAQDTFEKTQTIYELLRDGLDEAIQP